MLLALFTAFPLLAKTNAEREMTAYPEKKCHMVMVSFTNKAGTPYSLQKPLRYISLRALQRRERQGLTVDSTDLPVSPVYLQQLQQEGITIVGTSKWNNAALVKGRNLQQLLRLGKLPFVASVKEMWTSPDSIPSRHPRENVHDEFREWNNVPGAYYGVGQEQISSLNGIHLHDKGFRGSGKVIAVVDGGFMNVDRIPAFEDAHILGTKDFVVGSRQNVYREIDHGTKVLSTMAMNKPEVFVGTAPDASYWLLRSEDTNGESLVEEFYWAEAVEFADSVGADVISSSLGYHDFDNKKLSHKRWELDGNTALISRTASLLADKGIVLVSSAGNDGMGVWKKIGFPADARDIITVGSISPNGQNAPFSSIGPTADGRIKPDVMAYGSPTAVVTGRGTILKDTGTSFSAPLVAGMVACLWQAHPKLTAKQIIDMVIKSGNNASTPDNIMGYGVPRF